MKKWVQSTTYSSIGFKWADQATNTQVGYSSEFSVCAVDVGTSLCIKYMGECGGLGSNSE